MGSNTALARVQKNSRKKGSALKKRESLKLVKKLADKTENSKPAKRHLDPAQIEALIVSHTEHGERLARSLLNRWRVKMESGDITSAVGLSLCEAAQRFNPTMGVAFKTFFFYHLRGTLIKEIIRLVDEHKLRQIPTQASGDAAPIESAQADIWPLPVVETKTPENLMQKQQIAAICWEACAELDELEKEVVLRAYVFDQPLNTIAKDLKYCRCHISRVKSRALAKLSAFLKDRLPDYRYAIFNEDPKDTAEDSQSASPKKRSYKGGRGRRKQLKAA